MKGGENDHKNLSSPHPNIHSAQESGLQLTPQGLLCTWSAAGQLGVRTILGGLIGLGLAGLSRVTSEETSRVPWLQFLFLPFYQAVVRGLAQQRANTEGWERQRARQRVKPAVEVLSTSLFASHLLSFHRLMQILWLSSSRKGEGLQGECQRMGNTWRGELELGNSPTVGQRQK